MTKLVLTIISIVTISTLAFFTYTHFYKNTKVTESLQDALNEGGPRMEPHPLSIETLRSGEYPGSEIILEQTLEPGTNYSRQIVSYKSDGLKIYGLLTIPNEDPPVGGYPAIIFNHGYIPPAQYRTTEKYIAYTDGFSRNGYVLFRPDYRGHGNSEGDPTGAYGSNGYTIDVLNAVASIKNYPNVNPEKIGMWGHSMGGFITLRNMVTTDDVKAGVIWAGVVASYEDLFYNWRRRNNPSPSPGTISTRGGSWRQTLTQEFGDPQANPDFWNKLSANFFLKDISGPIQLHHGTADASVPVSFSQKLDEQLKNVGKISEIYIYPGDDHNLSSNFGSSMNRSIEFFDKYLK